MTPGFHRFRGSSFLPSHSRFSVYTSWTEHPSIYITDLPPMFNSPRDAAVPRLRWDLVVRVRREIEAGTYETPDKWETALARLQKDLEHETFTNDEQPTV